MSCSSHALGRPLLAATPPTVRRKRANEWQWRLQAAALGEHPRTLARHSNETSRCLGAIFLPIGRAIA
jgi:hypothetical protein